MKQQLLLLLVSVMIGGVILVISLASSIRGGNISPKEYLDSGLLFHSQVIPGHIFYPFFVFRDKYQIFQATNDEQFPLRLELARMRLHYAGDLLDLGAFELSVSTLKKSQHYAFSSQKFLNSAQEGKQLMILIEEIQDLITQHKEEFSDEQKAFLDNLFTENHYLLEQLTQQW